MAKNRIKIICEICGKVRLVAPYLKHKARFCSLKCHGSSLIGSHRSEQTKEKIGLGMRRIWVTNQMREVPDKISIAARERWQDPKFRDYISQIMNRPEVKQKRAQSNSRVAKQNWQKPEYVERVMKAIHAKPNKPEQRLMDIFSRHLPQFQYNGDFSLGITLGGLIPDFVNVNGKKEVIELLGDYFHSPEVLEDRWQGSELGKVMLYNSLGYQCMVIWEHELNKLSEDELVEKANKFFSKHRRTNATI